MDEEKGSPAVIGASESDVRQGGEAQQSLHLLRGLQEMDSTGFSRKGVIEIGAGDIKEPFKNFDDDDDDADARDDGRQRRLLVEELDDEEESGDKDEETSLHSRRPAAGGSGGEFLRSGGVVDYNLNVFGFQ